MNLYFFEGFGGNSQIREALLIEVLSMYCDEKNIEVDPKDIKIYRESGQKPYANLKDVHFNISHSGCLWVCAVSDSEIGIDIQEIVNKDFTKLAKRYFTEKEQHHIELWGSEGFYNIWVRKEAYCKLKGQSVFSVLSNIETIEKDFYKNKIEEAFIYEVEISPDIKCVVASREEGKEICIRLIN
jgi:4'-phosphopantetheinyl transferase